MCTNMHMIKYKCVYTIYSVDIYLSYSDMCMICIYVYIYIYISISIYISNISIYLYLYTYIHIYIIYVTSSKLYDACSLDKKKSQFEYDNLILIK